MTTTYPPLRLKITPRNSLKLKVQSGAAGPKGDAGAAGIGLPPGGTLGQVLAKASGVDFNTQWITPGTLSDGDKGDIVVSGGGSIWTIDNKSALTKADDTNVTLTLGGTPATALLQPVSITLGWAGALSVPRGGTGVNTLANRGVLIGQGASAVAVTAAMTAGQLLVGQAAVNPIPQTISGDLTCNEFGVMTIASGAVTNAKLANMASGTYKMRVSGGSGPPEDATAAQATAGLNIMVGDSGSGGLKGLVPAPITGDATKFLRGDGVWGTPAGSGGNVNGPGSSTDNAVARFNGTAGTSIQNSGVIIDDSNNVSGVGTLASGANTITAQSTNALAVGRLGATTPALQVDSNTASSITGVKITAAATGGGVSVAAQGETNVALKLDGAGTGAVRLATVSSGGIECGNPLSPSANDGAALGTTSLKWSDLFLASGAVINFNSGDVTITHSAEVLAFAGAGAGYSFDSSVSLAQLFANSYFDIAEIASPANPSADRLRLFAKDVAGSTHLFTRDSTGSETDLLSGGATGAVLFNSTQALTQPQQGVALKNIGAAQGRLINGKITESRAANAATFAVKGLDGNDPSATNPVTVIFDDGTTRALTAALSVTVSSGSTLGATNSTAFRVWIVIIDDAATLRLGVQNCSDASSIKPFPSNGILSSTAEGGAGAADSMGVTYTGTAVSAKQFATVAFAEYDSGLATAGTWASAPSRIVHVNSHTPMPGSMLQTISATSTPNDSTTSATYIVTSTTIAITPSSPANKVKVSATGFVQGVAGVSTAQARFSRGNTANTNMIGGSCVVTAPGSHQYIVAFDHPNTGSSQTYAVQLKAGAGGSTVLWGSTFDVYIEAQEFMG